MQEHKSTKTSYAFLQNLVKKMANRVNILLDGKVANLVYNIKEACAYVGACGFLLSEAR